MRRSARISKFKPQCNIIQKPHSCNQDNDIKNRLHVIAVIIENIIYHEGDIEYSAARNYLNVVKTIKGKLPNHSELLSFCDLLINQLNKIIEIINVSLKIETNAATNKGNDHIIENGIHSSQETYCTILENGDIDPADTNELGSDINIAQNNRTVPIKIVDCKIVPQPILKDSKIADKPIDLSSHNPNKSTINDVLIQKDQPIDYSSKLNPNQDKSIPTFSNINKSKKKNIQTTKPEINSCPISTNHSKSNDITNKAHSEQSVFRKPLNYKSKLQKNRRVLKKSQIVEVSNETINTKKMLGKIKIDKTKMNKTIQIRPKNNVIKKAKTIYQIVRKPEQEQFTIHFNASPQNSQITEKLSDAEETYNSEDCFDNIFADDQTDTDENLIKLSLKCKQLNINENSENTVIISEIDESTDWTIESPIVEIQPEPQQINEHSGGEDLQNKIEKIKSQENFKYDENESVVTNIRNYRKTFVRKILQLRDVLQETPVKHQLRKNVNSLFKSTTEDGFSAEIIKSQYTCPPSPKTERYKAVETFVNRENESNEEFIKRLKDKSRELSEISIQELLQKMDNYSRL